MKISYLTISMFFAAAPGAVLACTDLIDKHDKGNTTASAVLQLPFE